jgi:rare lipoprotein A
VEPVRSGGPNKPYVAQGETIVPLKGDPEVHERGLASWYGKAFHGRRTASGETYDMYALTAAHKTMPIPSYARVRNPANGREVIVRINDRGPFVAGRVIDLSYAAAVKLGTTRAVTPVELERITHQDIRTGAWKRGGAMENVAAAAPAEPASAPMAEPAATVVASTGPVAAAALAAPPDSAAPAPMPVPPTATATAPMATPGNPEPRTPQPAYTSAARGYWLQLGAFNRHDGAVGFRRQVEQLADWLVPLLAVFDDRGLHRLQAGPYATRAEAQGAAEKLRAALQLVPVVLERR